MSLLNFQRLACWLCASLIFGATSPLFATTYTFTGGSMSPTGVPVGITASNFGSGAGLTGGAPLAFFGPSANGVPSDGILVRTNTTTSSEASAVAGDDYVGFTVTPGSNFLLNLQNLTFNLTSSDNLGPTTDLVGRVAVRTSLDGFASTIDSYVATNAGAGTPLQSEWTLEFLDLSSPAFQSISTPVEFRFYIFDNTTNEGDVLRFDNFSLTATTTALPEPASMVLFVMVGGLACAGWCCTRKRRGA